MDCVGNQQGRNWDLLKQEVQSESWKLNLLGWIVCSWDQELGAERGNNSVMRMTFEKGNSDRVMDRTTAVPKKHKFGENRQVHVLTREQASPQRCKLDLLYCQEIFVKPFVAVPHTLLLLAHLVMKLDCYLPFMVLIKNQIYMPELTVAALLITHKCN